MLKKVNISDFKKDHIIKQKVIMVETFEFLSLFYLLISQF